MSTLGFTLTVTMLSDWHIGSGQGRHRSIDRLIDRDKDGLLYLPSGTERGILRDAAQTLARGLDNGASNGPWSRFADEIFGSEPALNQSCEDPPIGSRMTLDDGRFPKSLRKHLVGGGPDRQVLRQALTFVKPGVSINRRSGRARKEFLRFEEVARAGAVLEARGKVNCPDAAKPVTAAFLAGAAALIERLGGKRRRGMGKCKVDVRFDGKGFAEEGHGAAEFLEQYIKENSGPPCFSASATAGNVSHGFAPADKHSGWTKIQLRLALLSPLIATDEVRGNVVTCQSHIPGSLLLPHVAQCLEDAGLADVWQRIASGDIRVLPSTLEIEGERSLPVPMCWEEPKAKGSGLPWRHIREDDGDGGPQYKPVRTGFLLTRTDRPEQVVLQRSVEKIMRTHNTVEDEFQRPGERVGGVYTYEALVAEQTFRTEVWIRGTVLNVDKVKDQLAGEASFGRARQAGYGRVQFDVLGHVEDPAVSSLVPNKLSIWLTADAILPAAAGCDGLAALKKSVAAAAGCAETDLAPVWANLRWHRIEGWQSRWGLPRPTLTALQAGSVAVFELQGTASVDIARLEREGIGERLGEGFGCVFVNHTYLDKAPTAVRAPKTEPQDAQQDSEAPAVQSEFLETISRRAWERCIALRAEMATATEDDRKKLLHWLPKSETEGIRPNMSQLGALRAVMGELSEDDATRVKDWIAHLKTISTRADKWPRDNDKKPIALDKIHELMDQPQGVLAELGLVGEGEHTRFAGAPKPETPTGLTPLTDPDLQRFAVRTLLLKAIRAHKRDSEKEQPKHEEAAA